MNPATCRRDLSAEPLGCRNGSPDSIGTIARRRARCPLDAGQAIVPACSGGGCAMVAGAAERVRLEHEARGRLEREAGVEPQ